MHKRTAALVLTGALAVGTVGAVAITPASASTSSNPVSSRLAWIKDALKGLVSDGTITQAQADKVANTLNNKLAQRPFGGPGHRPFGMGLREGLGAAAKALNMTPQALLTQLRSGKSLADIAKVQGVTTSSLEAALMTAAEDQLKAAVTAGKLTQAQADTIKNTLSQRISDLVTGTLPMRGFGGMGRWAGPGAGQPGAPTSPTTPSGGATTSGAGFATA